MKKILFIILMIPLASCERLLMPGDCETGATATFDHLWGEVDKKYSMFDVKEVDWQRVYDTLRPRVSDGMSDDSLFAVCAAMLSTLCDGHVNLFNDHDISHSDSIYYRFYADSQIDINAVALTYLGAGYHTTGGIAHNAIDSGRIAYLRYSSFSSDISIADLQHLVRLYADKDGLILDIRGNGGGSITNIYNILSILPSKGQHLYSSQIKSGPGHEDFSLPVATYAPENEDEDSNIWKKPVVVLVDRGCFSAASMFAVCCRAYPEVILLGDTTGGGLGLPTMGYLPNGWRYRISITRLLTPEGDNFENGVPPDKVMLLDREDALATRRDNIIDEACRLMKSER